MSDELPEEMGDVSAETPEPATSEPPQPEYKIGTVVGISRDQQSVFVSETLPLYAKSAYAMPEAAAPRAFVPGDVLAAGEIDVSQLREGEVVQYLVGEDGFLVQEIKKVDIGTRGV